MEHTEREYELEDKLWDLLTMNQQYILSVNEGDRPRAALWMNKIRNAVLHWMTHGEEYLQHPKWQEDEVDPRYVLRVDAFDE